MLLNPAIYIAMFLPLLIIFIQQSQNQKMMIKQMITSKRKNDLLRAHRAQSCLPYIGLQWIQWGHGNQGKGPYAYKNEKDQHPYEIFTDK